ncbi:MAG: hypothetical protein ACRD2E_07945 [Terriglobales bacterium]
MSGQSLGFALIPLPGGAVAAFNAGGVWYCARPDWEGSSRLTSSPSRTETGGQAYSPCGATYAGASLGRAGGSWRGAFAGHWDGTPDNLDGSPFRLLAPMMEFPREIPLARPRWLSPDTGAPGAQLLALGWEPAGLAAVNPANPQTSTPGRSTAPWGAPVRNAYAYVANQPLQATDTVGLDGSGGGQTIGGGNPLTPSAQCEAEGLPEDCWWNPQLDYLCGSGSPREQLDPSCRQFATPAPSKGSARWGGLFTEPDPVHFYQPGPVDRARAIAAAQAYYHACLQH